MVLLSAAWTIVIQVDKVPLAVQAALSALYVLLFIADSIFPVIKHVISVNVLILWIFAVAVASIVERVATTILPQFSRLPTFEFDAISTPPMYHDFTRRFTLLLIALFLFSHFLYPRLKASWGGGGTVPVVVMLTKDSPVYPQ